ncbi:MAG: DUF655 domain-containing protein [Thermoprotei archaeon]|nr:MAG: DUF655 domain-containing protein [Thermoprotei archaeon]RLE90214.1 MAG: DUF655 domain-containing protein [Thermoprotei archaeon]
MSRYASRRPTYYEEYAYVLDFLPQGYYSPSRVFIRGPIAQVVGEQYFILLEVCPFPGITLQIGERIYIGTKEISLKIRRVLRRIRYEDLTARAKSELERMIETIVERRAHDFIKFFNEAQPLTPRMHSLELLRGIGKKTLWKILEERRKKPFESFEDIQNRTRIADPKRLIVNRIIQEIMDSREKYHVFTAPSI